MSFCSGFTGDPHAIAISGKDPYLEGRGLWADFHTKLIGEIERKLAAALPERYFVQTGRALLYLPHWHGR